MLHRFMFAWLIFGLVSSTIGVTVIPDPRASFAPGQSFMYYEYSPHSISAAFSESASPVLYVRFNTTTPDWRPNQDQHYMYTRIMDFGIFEPGQGDTLVYEVYWNSDLPIKIAMDLRTKDPKLITPISFENILPTPQDQNKRDASVNGDLRPLAITQWYRRQIPIRTPLMNRGGVSFWIGCARTYPGVYAAQFRSISIINTINGRQTIIYGEAPWHSISMITSCVVTAVVVLFALLIVCRQRKMQRALKKWQATDVTTNNSPASASPPSRSPASSSPISNGYSRLNDGSSHSSTVSNSPASNSAASSPRSQYASHERSFHETRFCCIRPPPPLSHDSLWIPLVSWSMLLPVLGLLLFCALLLTITASALDSWVVLDHPVSITFGLIGMTCKYSDNNFPTGTWNYDCSGLTCAIVKFSGFMVFSFQILSSFLLTCILLSLLYSHYRRWYLTEQQRHLPSTYLIYQSHTSNISLLITIVWLCMAITVVIAAIGLFLPLMQDVTNILHTVDHGINNFPTLNWNGYTELGISWVIQCVPLSILFFVTPVIQLYHRWVLTVTIKQREQWVTTQLQRQYLQRRFAFWLHEAEASGHHSEQQMQPIRTSLLPGISGPLSSPQSQSQPQSPSQPQPMSPTITTPTNNARSIRSMSATPSTSTTSVAYLTSMYQKLPMLEPVREQTVVSVVVESEPAPTSAPTTTTTTTTTTSPLLPPQPPLAPAPQFSLLSSLAVTRARSASVPFSMPTSMSRGLTPPAPSSRIHRNSVCFELSQPLLDDTNMNQQSHVHMNTRYSRTDLCERADGDDADD